MTLYFWRNPELERHVRAKLRRARLAGIALSAILAHAIVALFLSLDRQGSDSVSRDFYFAALGMEAVIFVLWCSLACGRAVPGERQARTWDFLRVTRMSPLALAFGKVLGEPIAAYVFLACSLPFGVAAGLAAEFGAGTVVAGYGLLVVLGIFVGLLALFASMFLERGAGGAAALFLVVQLQAFTALAPLRPLSGFAAVSVVPAVLELHGRGYGVRPTLFGFSVPFVWASLLLLAVLGGLVALATLRNLKRDLDRMVVYERRQVIGIATLLNALFYALIDPAAVGAGLAPAEIARAAVGFNAVLFFLAALVLVAPKETLKVWSRGYVAGKERYVSESGPPWPWLLFVGAIAYAAFAIEAFALRRHAPLAEWPLAATAVVMLVLLAFGVRDLLLLQWCRVTRLRRPLATGLFAIAVVHASTAVLAAAWWWRSPILFAHLLALTPLPALHAAAIGEMPGSNVWIGAAMQIVPATLFLRSISNRSKRPLAP